VRSRGNHRAARAPAVTYVVGVGLAAAVVAIGMLILLGRSPSKHHARDVVRIASIPYPEGSIVQPSVDRGDPRGAPVFALLPSDIPPLLRQPDGCTFGNMVTLTLRDGTELKYGPCVQPRAIEAIGTAMLPINEGR
jgi:hypothetical protein